MNEEDSFVRRDFFFLTDVVPTNLYFFSGKDSFALRSRYPNVRLLSFSSDSIVTLQEGFIDRGIDSGNTWKRLRILKPSSDQNDIHNFDSLKKSGNQWYRYDKKGSSNRIVVAKRYH